MKFLERIIEYGLYLLVFVLPWQTRYIIKAGEINGGYWEYGTISLYATDVLLILLIIIFIIYKFYSHKFSIFHANAGPRQGGGNFSGYARSGEARQFSNKSQILPRQRDPAKVVTNTKSKIPGYWYIIAGLNLMVLISIFFAPDKLVAVFSFLRFLLGIGLFWLIVSVSYDKLKLIISLLFGMMIQAGLAIWQFIYQSSFSSKWLGLALHQATDLGTSVIETVGSDGIGERWLRAYGGLDHPNVLGGLLTVGLILVIGLILKYSNNNFQFSTTKAGQAISPPTGDLPKGDNFQSKKNERFILSIGWVIIIIFFIALIFTWSRAAWLALFISLVVLLIISLVRKNLLRQKSILEIILVLGMVVFILFNLYQNLFITRSLPKQRLEIKSYSERILSYKNFRQIIKDSWLTGTGMGNYTLILHDQMNKNLASFDYQPVHNVFLLAWAEIGILGIIFFTGLIIYLLITNYQFLITNKMPNAKCQMPNQYQNQKLEIRNWKLEIGQNGRAEDMIINFSILIALIIIMSLDHWWWSLHFGILFFWLVVGLIIKAIKLNSLEK